MRYAIFGMDVHTAIPPMGKLWYWFEAAIKSLRLRSLEIAVFLVPARTDTRWFHEWCVPFGEVRFIRGRLTFQGAHAPAPFPSMIVVFRHG